LEFEENVSEWSDREFRRFLEPNVGKPERRTSTLLSLFVSNPSHGRDDDHAEELLELFPITGNHEISKIYLQKAQWNVERAADLYLNEVFVPKAPQQEKEEDSHEAVLTEMDYVTCDRRVSERFLRQANWNVQDAVELFLEQASPSPAKSPHEFDGVVSEMFDVTGDNELSVEYLAKANWDYGAAVNLFLEERFGGQVEREPGVPAGGEEMIRALADAIGDERRAREYLVQMNWNEEAATRRALSEMFGIEE
jgi:hypothetical protein